MACGECESCGEDLHARDGAVCNLCRTRDHKSTPERDDCLNCGVCEWCIERSIAAAEEADTNTEEG